MKGDLDEVVAEYRRFMLGLRRGVSVDWIKMQAIILKVGRAYLAAPESSGQRC